MTILNYWVSDAFLIGVVIVVIIFALVFYVKLRSAFLSYVDKLKNIFSDRTKITNNDDLPEEDMETSAGELRLIGVDERTAAIIIATVSDHLKIPLNELQFKSIKILN
jgi:hypothetical protein